VSVMTWALRADRPRRLRVPFIVAFAAAALAAGLGRAVTTTYLPLLLDRIADAPGLIGMVMLVNAAAGMVVPLVTGVWSDRLGRRGRARRLPRPPRWDPAPVTSCSPSPALPSTPASMQ
jgi:MFS family permease